MGHALQWPRVYCVDARNVYVTDAAMERRRLFGPAFVKKFNVAQTPHREAKKAEHRKWLAKHEIDLMLSQDPLKTTRKKR